MESRQSRPRMNMLDADGYEDGEAKIAKRQTRAQIMRPDIWTMLTGVRA